LPVNDPQGESVAALTVAGPATRLTRARIEEFLPRLLSGASSISKALAGRIGP
jgi:DNA-binding IclR family transcriptional regulator